MVNDLDPSLPVRAQLRAELVDLHRLYGHISPPGFQPQIDALDAAQPFNADYVDPQLSDEAVQIYLDKAGPVTFDLPTFDKLRGLDQGPLMDQLLKAVDEPIRRWMEAQSCNREEVVGALLLLVESKVSQ